MGYEIPKDVEQRVEEAQYKSIATLLVAGIRPSAIAEQLKVSRYFVAKIMKQDDFKTFLRELTSQMVETAANTWKAAMQDRVVEALRVLDKNLKNDNLEAVKIIIRTIGVEKQEAQVQSSNLTVVLPGASTEKVIEVKSED